MKSAFVLGKADKLADVRESGILESGEVEHASLDVLGWKPRTQHAPGEGDAVQNDESADPQGPCVPESANRTKSASLTEGAPKGRRTQSLGSGCGRGSGRLFRRYLTRKQQCQRQNFFCA